MHGNLKRSLLLFFIVLSSSTIYGQQNCSPSYVDGVDGLNEFFREHMDLKQFDLDRKFRGTIVLRLHVDFLGKADSMYVWFSPSKELGEEALRVIKMTRESWIPCRKEGAFSDDWVQYSYHICREYNCGHTREVYELYKRKSFEGFLDGDVERGIEYLRKAIYAEPSHGEDFLQLAKVLIENGGDPDICTYLEIAQELTGNIYPEYLERCGEVGEQYLLNFQAVREFDPDVGVSIQLQALEEDWRPEYPGDRPSLDDRYPGGANSLMKFLGESVSFPEMSVMKVHSGLSVASLTISPEGLIEEVTVLNRLGSWMDEQAFRLLQRTRGRWKAAANFSGSQTFVIQINYTFKPNCGKDDHIRLRNDSTLQEIVICAIDVNDEYQSNDQLASRARGLIATKKYSEAFPFLNELVHRDPFNSFYQEQIAECYQELGWKGQESHKRGQLENFYAGDSMIFLDRKKAIGSRNIIQPLKKGGYSVREIRLDSSIVYSGKLSALNPEIKNGTFYFYHEDGRVRVRAQYLDNYPVGIWNYYNPSGEIGSSLDYASVFEFLEAGKVHPFLDSTYIGRTDLGANERGCFSFVEKMPRFRGGDPSYSFQNYLMQAIKYPEYAQYHGIEESVLVQFTVDQTGHVRDPTVLRGVHPDLIMEALRVIISSPSWTPGKMGRDEVGVVYTFPVNFHKDMIKF